jgi:arginase
MNATEIQQALDDIFDQALLFHGYRDYMRDYELIVYGVADPRTRIRPNHLRYLFKYCVEADVRSTVRADVWRRSLDDRLTHMSGRKFPGYVWGVKWQGLYPGGRVIEKSDRARVWSESIGIPFHEIVIKSNAHVITLVASDLEVTEVDPGHTPFVVGDERTVSPFVIDAPSVLGLFPRGVETLPDALHARGLMPRVRAVDRTTLTPPPFVAQPDPTGVNNASALVDFADSLSAAVGTVLDGGDFPLILGGDCSIIFGPLLALARRGRSGLLFLDGHADFAHPAEEPSGEAASMELGLATGRTPDGFGPIGGFDPLIEGYRLHDDGTDTNLGTNIEDTAITTIDLTELRRRGLDRAIADALGIVARNELDGFWIHIDADVLDDALMPAVDYRKPDGLSWEELTTIVRTAIATGRARGLELTIFNPTLDPDGTLAERLVAFLADALIT